MSNRKAKQEAEALLEQGFTHQQAFDQLAVKFPEIKPRRMAGWLRHKPSQSAIQRYRSEHLLLLALVALSALLRSWAVWRELEPDQWHTLKVLQLVPFFTLLMGYGLYKWEGEVFQFVGWLNMLGALGVIRSVASTVAGGGSGGELVGNVLSLAIAVVALYVHRVAFPKYARHKDPMGGPEHHVFTERP